MVERLLAARMPSFADLSGDFVATVNLQERIEFMNRAGRRMLGIAEALDLAEVPLYVRQLHAPNTHQRLSQEVFPSVLAGGVWSGSIDFRALDGSVVPMQLTVIGHHDEDGRVTAISGVGHDRRTQLRLATQEALAQRIIDNTIEGVLVTDAHARILRVNQAFSQITGYAEAEVLGQTPRMLRSHHHDQTFYDAMNAALASTGHWQGEVWNRRRSGQAYLQWMSLSALYDHHGQVTHYVSIFHDLTEMRAKEARIEQLAFSDPLTGLGNRYKLLEALDGLTAAMMGPMPSVDVAAATLRATAALLCVDVGHLGPINDRFGMAGGDRLIRHQSTRVRNQLQAQPGVALFRVSGDELMALVRQPPDGSELGRVAEECIRALQVPLALDGEVIRMSPSVGIALYPKDAVDGDGLMSCAQTALMEAKRAGRDRYRFYDEALSEQVRQRLLLEQQLRQALGGERPLGLQLYLQPQVRIGGGEPCGAEVLLRWDHPSLGMIPPSEFVPLAEESRLIIELDRWVFAETCRMVRDWVAMGVKMPPVSVNLSARHIIEPDLANWYRQTLESFALAPGSMEIEITETAFIEPSETVVAQLHQLRECGFRIALDDFGTGFSSLTCLARLPLDRVKLDRSFVAGLGQEARTETLLEGVTQLLSKLGFDVVAEGVETVQQAQLLAQLNCGYAQGYLFHRPMPAAEFAKRFLGLDAGV